MRSNARAVAGGVDDGPHGDADLVVGVGGRRRRRGGRSAAGGGTGVDRAADEAAGQARRSASAAGSPVTPRTTSTRAVLADRRQQLQLERPQALRQVDDDPAQPGRQVGGRPLDGARPAGRPRRTSRCAAAGRPRRRPAPARRRGRAGERGHRAGAGAAQLAVEVAEGDDRRLVVLDAGVEAGVGVDDAAHGEVDDGRRDRAAALGVQRRRAEQLGEAERREHVDGGEAAAAAEGPAGHHAGGVGRHDDRHRGQRVAALQRLGRPPASASSAAAPQAVVVTCRPTASIVRRGCHGGRGRSVASSPGG